VSTDAARALATQIGYGASTAGQQRPKSAVTQFAAEPELQADRNVQ